MIVSPREVTMTINRFRSLDLAVKYFCEGNVRGTGYNMVQMARIFEDYLNGPNTDDTPNEGPELTPEPE
jgi:hypothetical protein